MNVTRRLSRGLPARGESVFPEVRNDLFQAHLSIYLFFSQMARHQRVLDVGSGTGYGVDYLRKAGAAEVVGIDRDERSVRYSRRFFSQDGVSFLVGDAETLPLGLGKFGLVVSSNVFEHLSDPARALDRVAAVLERGGRFLLVVPPITDVASLQANQENRFHKSNLFIGDWLGLLKSRFAAVSTFRHLPPAGTTLDFTSPFPSMVSPSDFKFVEVEPSQMSKTSTLGAVFSCAAVVEELQRKGDPT